MCMIVRKYFINYYYYFYFQYVQNISTKLSKKKRQHTNTQPAYQTKWIFYVSFPTCLNCSIFCCFKSVWYGFLYWCTELCYMYITVLLCNMRLPLLSFLYTIKFIQKKNCVKWTLCLFRWSLFTKFYYISVILSTS